PDEQVVRSSHNIEEKNQSKENAQNVSAENNIPNANQNAESGNNSNSNKTEEITNYDISKEIRKFVKGRGKIKKLSIAVLVDYNYVKNENGQMVDIKRDEVELSNIEKLVKSAVGFDADRGDNIEVVNMKFYELSGEKIIQDSTWQDWLEIYSYDIIKMILWTIIILLIAFFVIKPLLIKWLEINNTLPEAGKDETEDGNNIDILDNTNENNDKNADTEVEQITISHDNTKKIIIEKLKYAIDNNKGNISGMIKHIINS
ncbi:MAG: hypothetical protein OEY79_03530, partial [Anaplasmataceae bacterium]|nr:hypothetical protein [Anaplasmataceae bacterium]